MSSPPPDAPDAEEELIPLQDNLEAELGIPEVAEGHCERSSALRRLRGLSFAGRRAAAGLAVAGCLAFACLAFAGGGWKPKGWKAAEVEETEVVGLVGTSRQQWQCDGGPGFGTTELVSRQMDPNSNTAYVRCCKCFGVGKLGATPQPCSGPVSWHEAKRICMQHGMRLCTKEELEDSQAADTGCGYDDHYVWATDQPYGFTSQGAGSVCRRDPQDRTMDGRGSAIVLAIGPKSECEKKCLKEMSCTGYEYRSTESRCEIWTKPITFHTTAIHKGEFDCKVKTCKFV